VYRGPGARARARTCVSSALRERVEVIAGRGNSVVRPRNSARRPPSSENAVTSLSSRLVRVIYGNDRVIFHAEDAQASTRLLAANYRRGSFATCEPNGPDEERTIRETSRRGDGPINISSDTARTSPVPETLMRVFVSQHLMGEIFSTGWRLRKTNEESIRPCERRLNVISADSRILSRACPRVCFKLAYFIRAMIVSSQKKEREKERGI